MRLNIVSKQVIMIIYCMIIIIIKKQTDLLIINCGDILVINDNYDDTLLKKIVIPLICLFNPIMITIK